MVTVLCMKSNVDNTRSHSGHQSGGVGKLNTVVKTGHSKLSLVDATFLLLLFNHMRRFWE
jgi:hypothetical protein